MAPHFGFQEQHRFVDIFYRLARLVHRSISPTAAYPASNAQSPQRGSGGVFAGRGRRAGVDCDAEALWLRRTKARAQPAKRVAHPDKE